MGRENRIASQTERCRIIPGKNWGEGEEKRKKRGRFWTTPSSPTLPIALTRNVKIESSEPATGTRYVRSGARLMATFVVAHASRED